MLVAPCRPTQSDVWGLDDLDQLVSSVSQVRDAADKPIRPLVVLNMTDPLNIHQMTEQALEAINEMDAMEYSGCSVMMRPTFNAAFQSGRGIADLDASKENVAKARADVERLYEAIFQEEASHG